MHWGLSLIMAPLLAAAGAPPLPCGPATISNVLPSHALDGSAMDASGHAPSGLAPSGPAPFGRALSPALPEKPLVADAARDVSCSPPNPSARPSDSLRDVNGDALHGLSTPDLMQVIPNPLGH